MGGVDADIIRASAASLSRRESTTAWRGDRLWVGGPGTPVGPEQVEVAAAHQCKPVLDEANGPAARAIGPPGSACRHAAGEQAAGDAAVIVAREKAVEGTQHEFETTAAMGREAVWLWLRTADQQLPKPTACLEPVFKEAVERQHECEGPVIFGTGDKQRLARWGEGEKIEVLALRSVNDSGRIRS